MNGQTNVIGAKIMAKSGLDIIKKGPYYEPTPDVSASIPSNTVINQPGNSNTTPSNFVSRNAGGVTNRGSNRGSKHVSYVTRYTSSGDPIFTGPYAERAASEYRRAIEKSRADAAAGVIARQKAEASQAAAREAAARARQAETQKQLNVSTVYGPERSDLVRKSFVSEAQGSVRAGSAAGAASVKAERAFARGDVLAGYGFRAVEFVQGFIGTAAGTAETGFRIVKDPFGEGGKIVTGLTSIAKNPGVILVETGKIGGAIRSRPAASVGFLGEIVAEGVVGGAVFKTAKTVSTGARAGNIVSKIESPVISTSSDVSRIIRTARSAGREELIISEAAGSPGTYLVTARPERNVVGLGFAQGKQEIVDQGIFTGLIRTGAEDFSVKGSVRASTEITQTGFVQTSVLEGVATGKKTGKIIDINQRDLVFGSLDDLEKSVGLSITDRGSKAISTLSKQYDMDLVKSLSFSRDVSPKRNILAEEILAKGRARSDQEFLRDALSKPTKTISFQDARVVEEIPDLYQNILTEGGTIKSPTVSFASGDKTRRKVSGLLKDGVNPDEVVFDLKDLKSLSLFKKGSGGSAKSIPKAVSGSALTSPTSLSSLKSVQVAKTMPYVNVQSSLESAFAKQQAAFALDFQTGRNVGNAAPILSGLGRKRSVSQGQNGLINKSKSLDVIREKKIPITQLRSDLGLTSSSTTIPGQSSSVSFKALQSSGQSFSQELAQDLSLIPVQSQKTLSLQIAGQDSLLGRVSLLRFGGSSSFRPDIDILPRFFKFPEIRGGGGSRGRGPVKKRKKSKREYGYTPDFTSFAFNIRTSKPKVSKTGLSGFELRPIIRKKKGRK